MTPVRLQLLGVPAIIRGTEDVIQVPHRHRVALLALLAVQPARTLSRDKLITMLWPEQQRTNARNLLNVAVHGLRKVMGEDAIRSVGDDLVLMQDVTVDTQEFTAAVAAGRFDDAVRLYHGAFLDGFFLSSSVEFERWQDSVRSDYLAQYQRALTQLVADAASRDALADAVQWHQRLVSSDPFNTRSVLDLMLALERAGDTPNALHVAHTHELLLREELDTEPNPTFRVVVARMRAHPQAGPVPAEVNGNASTANQDGEARGAHGALLTGPALRPLTRRRLRLWAPAAVAAVGLVAIAAFRLRLPPLDEHRVVMAPFTSSEPTLAALASSAEIALVRAISGSEGFELVQGPTPGNSPEGNRPTTAVAERVRAHAQRVGAATILEGALASRGDSVSLDARLVSTASGRVVRTVHAASLRSGAPELVGVLSTRASGALAMVLDDRLATAATAEHHAPNVAALRAYRRGLDYFTRAEYDKAAEALEASAQADSEFTLANSLLAFTWYHGAQFERAFGMARDMEHAGDRLPATDRFAFEWLRARSRGDVPAAYRAAREAARLVPPSPWAFAQAEEALALRRPAEAVEILGRLNGESGWIRGWIGYRRVLGEAYHLIGDFGAELALVQRGRQVGTNLYASMIAETRPLAALGRWDEIERRIDEVLALPDQPTMDPGSVMRRAADELRAHGYEAQAVKAYRRAQRYYAPLALDSTAPLSLPSAFGRSLYATGDFDSARTPFTRALARLPDMYALQANLGLLSAASGDRDGALHFDSLLAAPETRWNAFDAARRVFLRAQISALLGNREQALTLLQQAAAKGVPVALDSIHIARELWSLRGWAPFDDLTRIHR